MTNLTDYRAEQIADEAARRLAQPELKPCHNPRNYKHGAYMRNKQLYNVWSGMIHRCENPSRENYERYGGRGISVCEEVKKEYEEVLFIVLVALACPLVLPLVIGEGSDK